MSSRFFLPAHFLQVQLVVLLLIDPPLPPHPTLPTSKGLIANVETLSLCGTSAAKGCPDGQADWTNNATPLYVPHSDVFGQRVPTAYGDVDRFNLNTADLRDAIIDSYSLLF